MAESTQSSMQTIMNEIHTENPDHSHIDWNAPYVDRDAVGCESEPLPPPNRAIYPLVAQPGWRVTVVPYDASWVEQFSKIQIHISTLLTSASPAVPSFTIEHIGSTSVPTLAAKPNIDVLVTLPSQGDLENALEAFAWEIPSCPPFIKYTRVPDGGGIKGRESLKLYVPSWSPYYYTTPERSVYLINNSTANPAGQMQIRCYRAVKQTLSDARNQQLLQEYGNLKIELAKQTFKDSITYSRAKDGVIRKILDRAGWTKDEIDEKERLSARILDDSEDPY